MINIREFSHHTVFRACNVVWLAEGMESSHIYAVDVSFILFPWLTSVLDPSNIEEGIPTLMAFVKSLSHPGVGSLPLKPPHALPRN